MRFQTSDANDIRWMNDPEGHEVGDVVGAIKAAGKWDLFLAQQQDEDGVVDCDALYDYLRNEGPAALLSVGLHYNEATATPLDVVKAWAEEYAKDGLTVSYCADGKTPSGFQLYNYGTTIGICLEFESIGTHGEVEEVSLDADEVFELVKDKAHGNATKGAWDCIDLDHAEFEMWRDNE